VVVPIAGMVHGYAEISWFFFAFGMIFWMVLLTIVMNRLFFHHPMPEHMIPTLCILIAPPAVGFLAYVKLTGSIDAFAHIIYYVALTFTIIVAMQIGAFRRIPFALSWWAYSFPLTAITIASIVMAEHGNIAALETLALTLYVVAAFVIAGLAARTLVGVARGEI
jgi:tellurite resistance protein